MRTFDRLPVVQISLLLLLAASDRTFADMSAGASVSIGPSPVVACEDEPLLLNATVVNTSTEEIKYILMATDWRFDIARQDGEPIVEHLHPYPSPYLHRAESYARFRMDPGQEVTFNLPFPILLIRMTDVEGNRIRIAPGSYVVTWHLNEEKAPLLQPYSEDDPRTWPWLSGSGSFQLEVGERNEGSLAEAYRALRDRFLQYGHRPREIYRDKRTMLEMNALTYTFEAVEDEFALPYFEQMKAAEDEMMRQIPEMAIGRIQRIVEKYGHAPVTPEEMRQRGK